MTLLRFLKQRSATSATSATADGVDASEGSETVEVVEDERGARSTLDTRLVIGTWVDVDTTSGYPYIAYVERVRRTSQGLVVVDVQLARREGGPLKHSTLFSSEFTIVSAPSDDMPGAK